MPVNAIWEGSGNVMALDVLRVLQREPETVEIVMEDLGAARRRATRICKAHLARVQALLHEPRLLDGRGRDLAEALATLAAGTILRAHAPTAVADAFIGTRLSGAGAPDLRPGARLGRYPRDRRPGAAGLRRRNGHIALSADRLRSEPDLGEPPAAHGLTISPSASMKSPRCSVRSTDRMRWSTRAAIGCTESRADLALGGQADRIHARVAAGALALQQALLDQSADDVGERGAVDAGRSTRPVWLMSGFE